MCGQSVSPRIQVTHRIASGYSAAFSGTAMPYKSIRTTVFQPPLLLLILMKVEERIEDTFISDCTR
jgi:hypothetical protein